MVFCQLKQTVPDAAAKGTEIAGIGMEVHIRQMVDNAVKPSFEEGQDLALTTTVLVGSDHIAVRLFIQNSDHIQYDLRTLLQVCVDEGNIVTIRVFHTGINCRFLTKVTGKRNDFYRAILHPIQFL